MRHLTNKFSLKLKFKLKNFFNNYVFGLLLLSLSLNLHAEVPNQLKLKFDKSVNLKLEEVLALAAEFHKVRVENDTKKSIQIANDMANKLSHLASVTDKVDPIHSLHITKIIQSAKNAIEVFNEDPDSSGIHLELKGFFKDIVQITQVFEVKKYKIFFCPQDNSLWLQAQPKAQNPVSPNLKNCGKPV